MAMFMQRAEHTAFPNISKKITFGADTAINDTEATLTYHNKQLECPFYLFVAAYHSSENSVRTRKSHKSWSRRLMRNTRTCILNSVPHQHFFAAIPIITFSESLPR